MTICFLLMLGCGGSITEQINPTPEGTTALSLSPQEQVYVAAANFTDSVGSIATVGLNNPHSIQTAKQITDGSDVVLKSFDGKLYVINRGGVSTIQVIDPESFKILGNYSVGSPGNPQDLVVANGKAFITRLDAHLDKSNADDLLIVDPLTGNKITGIDLKPYTENDGDRLARAAGMALAGDNLYVVIQDLSKNFQATTNGKVAVIDTKNNSIIDTVQLAGRNPTDIAYHADLQKIFVANSGVFDSNFNNDVTTAFGGIEVIDTTTHNSLGILVDDAGFGNYVSLVRIISENLGVVTVNAAVVASFNPTTLEIISKNLYSSPGAFLPELLVDKNGLLWVPERNLKGSGMILLDPQTGAVINGPFEVGALPASMSLIR
ncbi:MAG: hypothetical protein Q8P84_00465 [Deltaproteobacteria bacterium]|nr:hypothetical protein [Deltaproteobacteria bacterium]